jgi:ABC-type nitrate/sulfonate/bicarbonate transport system substrate-binding protein
MAGCGIVAAMSVAAPSAYCEKKLYQPDGTSPGTDPENPTARVAGAPGFARAECPAARISPFGDAGGGGYTFPAMNLRTKSLAQRSRSLRLGFVPLTDCAPLAMAQELGLFRKYGLHVTLCRELGWATVRDKIVTGELDAAQAVAGMPFAATLGLGSAPCECVTGLVLNLHGNGITLSDELWQLGVRDAASLRDLIYSNRPERTFTFGVVFPFSSHNFLLRGWLAAAGINPDADVRIVVVPPPQMPGALDAGHIDGYCVGEPWNTIAVQSRVGWMVAGSAELAPNHPEKVLVVRRDFAEDCAAEHEALIAALLDACAYCDQPENHARIVEVLSRRDFLGCSPQSLQPAFAGELDLGHGRKRTIADFLVFSRNGANEPSADKAAWVANHLRASKLATPAELTPAFARAMFRSDIFARACALRGNAQKPNENRTQKFEPALT